MGGLFGPCLLQQARPLLHNRLHLDEDFRCRARPSFPGEGTASDGVEEDGVGEVACITPPPSPGTHVRALPRQSVDLGPRHIEDEVEGFLEFGVLCELVDRHPERGKAGQELCFAQSHHERGPNVDARGEVLEHRLVGARGCHGAQRRSGEPHWWTQRTRLSQSLYYYIL